MHHLHLTRSSRPVLLAPLALTALAAAVVLPLLPETSTTPARVVQPATVALQALPAGPSALRDPAPATAQAAGRGVAALVEAQRRHGLDCQVTSLRLPVCSHGGDAHLKALPPLVHVASDGGSGSTSGTRVGCHGDGRDGHRVQAVYARPDGSADRFGAVAPDLRRYAAGADAAFDAAARTMSSRRHVRFVTTGACELDIARVVLAPSAFRSMGSLVDALQVKGFARPARTYLVWSESTVLCGIATMYVDDSPGLDNLNNGGMPSYARVDRPCWGKAELHELVHAFGGVQPSAPHATGGYHCSDGADVLCYDDGTAGSTQRAVCPSSAAQVLDCRHDDYFSTVAPRGSYLQTHWNVARSSFLSPVRDDPAPAPSASPTPVAAPPAKEPPPADPRPSPSPSPSASPSGLLGLVPLPPLPTEPAAAAPSLVGALGDLPGTLARAGRRS